MADPCLTRRATAHRWATAGGKWLGKRWAVWDVACRGWRAARQGSLTRTHLINRTSRGAEPTGLFLAWASGFAPRDRPGQNSTAAGHWLCPRVRAEIFRRPHNRINVRGQCRDSAKMMLVRLDASGTEALPQYRKYQPDVTLRSLKRNWAHG